MNQSLANKLVLCDLDNLLLGPDGNLTQVVRDVLQLFSSRGGRFTVFSQRTPKAVRALLGSVRLSAPALVCGGTLAYHFADGSRQPLCSFAGQDAGLFASLPSAAGVGIALQMQDGSTRVLRMSHALEQHLQQEWTPYLLANAADIRPDEVLRALVYQDNRSIPLTSLLEKALGDSTAALLGESLNLSPSPQLGQYYMVPYKDKKRGTVAQFQLGYKGYIQLAERSGQYLDIDAFPVVEGEYRGRDRFTRRPILEFLEDDGDRESRPVVGYYAYFELNNGFRKVLYWSKDKMLAHADRYSQAFHLEAREAQDPRYSRVSYADFVAGNYPKGDEWKYSSFWYKDFDGMACKTMLRQLISKWGIMSIDLQKALASDEAAIGADGSKNYLDAPENAPEALPEANPETGEVIEPSSNTAPELPDGIFEDATGQQALA